MEKQIDQENAKSTLHFVFLATFSCIVILYHLLYTCKHPQMDGEYGLTKTCVLIMEMYVCEMIVKQNIVYKFYL